MNREIDYTEQIERYIEGIMDKSEAAHFELLLAIDPKLQEELEIHKEIMLNIREHIFREKLKLIAEKYFKNFLILGSYSVNKRQLSFFSFLLLSAVLSSLFFLNKGTNNSSGKLFEQYYTAYAVMQKTRDTLNPDKQIRFAAIEHYAHAEYQQAYIDFKTISFKDSSDKEARFYTGLSAIGCKDFRTAVSCFSSVIPIQNPYYYPAVWYKSLCLLKLGQVPAAVAGFKELSESNSSYKKNAIQIINKLK